MSIEPKGDRSNSSGCALALVGLFCFLAYLGTTGFGIGPDRGDDVRLSLVLFLFLVFAGVCIKFSTWGKEYGNAAAKALAYSFYLPAILMSMLGQPTVSKLVLIFVGPLSVLANFWLVRAVERQLKNEENEV